VHEREPEAGADADVLGREDGSKMRSRTAGSMPVPVSRTASRTYEPGGRVQVETMRGCSSRQTSTPTAIVPSARHRLHGVGAQVHHHLVDLGRVAEHAGVAASSRRSSRTPRGQRRGDAVERLDDDRLHVHRHALGHAAAAEGEDALDQRLGAQARGERRVDVAAQRRALGGVLLRQLAVAEDRREDVVEVVGDAAGERADRLELLCLAQLQLEAVALGLGALLALMFSIEPAIR
jgi:hypothetical protein